MLGFMIECNHINEDDDYSQHSGGSNDNAQNSYVTEEGCARYVIWAAYVDLQYEGCGIGEYQYWDIDSNKWDASACNYGDCNGGSRCAKMDCHLESTSFSVLGFFKHKNPDDWMEQLFKHEGMCVWSTEQYSFMKNARKVWPGGCTYTGQQSNGDNDDDGGGGVDLYYNIKPLSSGRIGVGLYTDVYCLDEHVTSTDEVENVVGNIFQGGGGNSGGSQDNNEGGDGDYDFSSDSLYDSMKRWHSAFDVWHTCHPCIAHDLSNTAGDTYTSGNCYNDDYYAQNYNYNYNNDDDNDGNGGDDAYGNNDDANNDDANRRRHHRQRRRKLGDESCPTGQVFECYDDAGYTNVNQVSGNSNSLYACLPFLTSLYPHAKYLVSSFTVHEIQCQDCNEDGYIPRLGNRI